MPDPTLFNGVNLLPASGEWVYDTVPHRTREVTQTAPVVANLNAAPAGTRTDYSLSLDQLQAQHPECGTVSLIVAWFGSSVDAAQCRIHPGTIIPGGTSEALRDGAWVPDPWRCSGLTQASPGLIPLSQAGGAFVYGGTPADPAVVRCIRDLRERGLRVVFYPFLLMDCPGYPWRGRIGLTGPDMTAAATAAVDAFLGTAQPSQFTPDPDDLTVTYTGTATDYTFRRMILHYAALCAMAGGVDLFLLGSELRGLESIRGPGWTPAGAVDANGAAVWDYPFVAGLAQLAADVRATFDAAGLARDWAGRRNLIGYAADWSVWMGVQHADAAGTTLGQWPHLDALYAAPAVDCVGLDNYMPLSDWTTDDGGLDAANWQAPAPADWPPTFDAMNGLGLAGPPTLHSKAYLKANIEGGEKWSWFYADSTAGGRGLDPLGSDLTVSRPRGDRLAQARTPYRPGQELLANKRLRWWWANPHRAIYDAGTGFVPQGPPTAWAPRSKPIIFAEYGFPTVDRCTNQPNVFFDPKSSESATPFWSAWDTADGAGFRPRQDDALAQLALQAVHEYWTIDGNNDASPAGVPMIDTAFMAAWNWDARPFPTFPALVEVWGDAANYRAGTWIGGKGPFVPRPAPDAPPAPPSGLPTFPTLAGRTAAVRYRPLFATRTATHLSGREARAARRAGVRWEITMGIDLLAAGMDPGDDLAAFFAARQGQDGAFLLPVPPELGQGPTLTCRFGEDLADLDEFMDRLRRVGTLTLLSVPA